MLIKIIKNGRIKTNYFFTYSFNSLNKCFTDKNKNDEKIKDFYKFMEENIQKDQKSQIKNDSNSEKLDDINILLNLIKCPMTGMELHASEKGLSVGHITYPKRNGIYILREEEAEFNFE